MTVPVKDDADARYAAVKLGELLADITMSLSATEIHAMIVTRLRRSDYDARLARLVVGAGEFVNLWNALVQGVPTPATAWETVALPTLVAFSSPKTLKARLELATNLWLVIHDGSKEELAERAEGWAPEPQRKDLELLAADQPFGPSRMLNLFPTESLAMPAVKRRLSRGLVTLVVIVLTVAGGLWWFVQEPTSGNAETPALLPLQTGLPQLGATLSPDAAASPTAGVSPGAVPADAPPSMSAPPPAVSWTGDGAAVAPTAPHGLAVRNITYTGVAMSWQPPTNAGSGGISYYRVYVDGAYVGWTANTRSPISGLAPGVTYSFSIVAYNVAGLASPPSEVVTATTLARSPSPSTGPPAPPLAIGIDPSGSIALGTSFSVVGSGLPCVAPARVRVFLGGQPVAAVELDSKGSFTASVPIDNSDPAMPRFTVLTTGEKILLTAGAWPVVVKLASQSGCSVTANYPAEVSFY